VSIVKIIFIVAICFASLFILKKLVFNKIVIPITIFLIILFGNKDVEDAEKSENIDHSKLFLFAITVFIIFDSLECLLLFSLFTTLFYYIVYTSFMLFGNQLLSAYLAATLTLVMSCYGSKYYGYIYKLLNYKKKAKNEVEKIFNVEDKEDERTEDMLAVLSESFRKDKRYRNMLSEDTIKILSYFLAFLIVALSKIELFIGGSLFSGMMWINLSKVALESSVTFIAFDRFFTHIRKVHHKETA